MRFFADFSNFGSILGGPGPSKNDKKLKKSRTKRFWSALGVPWSLWEGFGSVLAWIWDGFGMILGGMFGVFFVFSSNIAISPKIAFSSGKNATTQDL